MSADRTPARPRRTDPARPRSGWLAIIVFAFLAGRGHHRRARAVGVYASLAQRPARSARLSRTSRRRGVDHLRPDRARSSWHASATSQREIVTFDQIPPILLDATTAVEDKTFWENAGFDPVAIISAALDLAARQQPRRLDDHPAARPRAAARPGARPGPAPDRRAQAQGDHPVDPPDQGVPGRGGQADDHHRLPQPELLREPELRREGGGR